MEKFEKINKQSSKFKNRNGNEWEKYVIALIETCNQNRYSFQMPIISHQLQIYAKNKFQAFSDVKGHDHHTSMSKFPLLVWTWIGNALLFLLFAIVVCNPLNGHRQHFNCRKEDCNNFYWSSSPTPPHWSAPSCWLLFKWMWLSPINK